VSALDSIGTDGGYGAWQVAILRKDLDAQQAQAAALLGSMPQPAPAGPQQAPQGSGSCVDCYA
jgi:hypothetical protein